MFAQEELAALQAVSKQKRPHAFEETTSTPAKRVNVESSQEDSERVLLSMAEWSHILQLRGDAIETKNQSKVAYVNALKKHAHVQTLSLNLHDDLMYLLLKTKADTLCALCLTAARRFQVWRLGCSRRLIFGQTLLQRKIRNAKENGR